MKPIYLSPKRAANQGCAVSMAGKLCWWDRNNHGQLGKGTEIDTVAPVAVSPVP
jgi:hypothetical protein